MKEADVLVIGAGLLGCFTARNLTRYEMDILVLEKESDVCGGVSKANTGIIYTGYDNRPGTLKSKLCIQANEAFDALTAQLNVCTFADSFVTARTSSPFPLIANSPAPAAKRTPERVRDA